MNNFHVGQKVVCVSDDTKAPAGHKVLTPIILPVIGKIYTIRHLMVGHVDSKPCVLVDEIPDQTVEVLVHGVLLVGSIVFDASAFRPLVTRPTSISIFTDILKTQRTGVDA